MKDPWITHTLVSPRLLILNAIKSVDHILCHFWTAYETVQRRLWNVGVCLWTMVDVAKMSHRRRPIRHLWDVSEAKINWNLFLRCVWDVYETSSRRLWDINEMWHEPDVTWKPLWCNGLDVAQPWFTTPTVYEKTPAIYETSTRRLWGIYLNIYLTLQSEVDVG